MSLKFKAKSSGHRIIRGLLFKQTGIPVLIRQLLCSTCTQFRSWKDLPPFEPSKNQRVSTILADIALDFSAKSILTALFKPKPFHVINRITSLEDTTTLTIYTCENKVHIS